MDGFLAKLIKYFVFATNFLVFLMAVVVCGFGIALSASGKTGALKDLLEAVDDNVNINLYAAATVTLIIVSALVMVVTFLGCCGALKENRCMLGLYFTVILTMFVALVVGMIIGYSQSLDEVQEAMLKSIREYDPTGETTDAKEKTITKSWDIIQVDFECCGVDKYEDWDLNPLLNGQVPESCCKGRDSIGSDDASIKECAENPDGVEDKEDVLVGCYTKVEDFINDNSKTLMVVTVVAVVIIFLNMIFSFAMCTMAD